MLKFVKFSENTKSHVIEGKTFSRIKSKLNLKSGLSREKPAYFTVLKEKGSKKHY